MAVQMRLLDLISRETLARSIQEIQSDANLSELKGESPWKAG
jgi:hypothetical protein